MRALGKDPLVMTDNQPDLQNTEGAVNVCDQVENPSKDQILEEKKEEGKVDAEDQSQLTINTN